MQEVAADLQRDASTGVHTIPDPLSLPDTGEIAVVLRVNASQVERALGKTAIVGNTPQADDFARAFGSATQLQVERADEAPLVLPGISVSIDDHVTGLGLPPGLPARHLQVSIPFITVRTDALATLTAQAAAQGCRIASVRLEVRDDSGQSVTQSIPSKTLTPADLSSLALWLDGIAKFIDITKARLPDLDSGRTLMMQRLFRHTMALKKRVQEVSVPDKAQ